MFNLGSVFVAPCRAKVSIAQKPGRIFSLLADFLPSASWLKPACFSKFGVGYPQEVKHNSPILTHKQKSNNADFYMAKQVWWYCFMFQILVADVLKSFPEASHFYFNYMILGWTVQYSGWVEKVVKTCQFPHGFYMLCFLQPKKYIVSVLLMQWWMHFMSSRMFFFEVPLIELVRNANFAKHLDLDAPMRFEMKWWRWWMMFLVLWSVTSNLIVGWRFFVPNDEQICPNCCSWLGGLSHWSLDCLRPWCQCRLCWWWKTNDLSVKDHCFLWHVVVWEETKMNTDFLHHIQSTISLHGGKR